MTRKKAKAIVARMTLAEKADLCSGADVWRLPANERLGLRSIVLTDGPHGVRKAAPGTHSGLARNLPATCFPTASALASSWDVDLMREIGAALGVEAASADVAVLLGPGMNIKRHPLCGRNFEYFSEDPLLSGQLAAALIDGIQSLGVGACVKHFAANDQEHQRMVVDVIADERTLREIHLRGFEIAARQSQPWTVMCAYNRINGVYCSENDWLLNRVLRDEWGFRGAVMTDWGAANDRVRGIEAGNDLEMPSSGGVNDRRIVAAVRRKDLKESVLDRSVARVVELVLKSRRLSESASSHAEVHHHALARRAAAEGAVLLKNDGNALPLQHDTRIAVIGAFAKQPRYQGTGSSRVTPTRLDCAFDAMRDILGSDAADLLLYAPGYDPELSEPDLRLIEEAVATAAEADTAVVFAGLPSVYESEGFDRPHMRLPDQHDRLIEAVCAANPDTIVVLANGAPVEMPWVELPKAILEAYLTGQASGPAVADLLFGRRSPCGKLAETFPLRQADLPSDAWFPGSDRQVQYREGLYVGYRYFDSFERPVLFPFGHGLSYTRFDYGDLRVTRDAGKPCRATLTLTNSGEVDGAEIVQVYVRRMDDAGPYRPGQELRGFAKVMLEASMSETITVDLDPHAFDFYDIKAGDWTTTPGEFEIRVGASSRDIRLRHRLTVDGTGRHDAYEANGKDRPEIKAGRLVVDDETFAAMLGRPVPPLEAVRPFHLNSTLSELEATWLGRLVAKRFKARFVERMGGSDTATQRMVERMAADTPLRSLVLFSGGRISFALANAFLAVLNGHYLKALGFLAGRR